MTIAANQTVGKIAASTPSATREFEKHGVDYCCGGGRTLAQACAQSDVSVDDVIARIEQSALAQPAVDRDWDTTPLSGLIAHINNTHHAFVRSECPRIEALAAKVAKVHARNHPELNEVRAEFSSLAEELRIHLMKEEQILFPYVMRMEESVLAEEPAPPAMFGTVANPIRMMMQEHDSAGEALRKIREITSDYKIPEDACISYRILFQALPDFEADLHQHIHLENNILFPRASAMESASSLRK